MDKNRFTIEKLEGEIRKANLSLQRTIQTEKTLLLLDVGSSNSLNLFPDDPSYAYLTLDD